MPRPSFLFFLRFLAVVLFLLVISDFDILIEIFTFEGFNNIKTSIKRINLFEPEKPIVWDEIDLEHPVFLNDSAAESLRLNEFLARPIFACGNRSEIGGDYDGFLYCFDREPQDGIQRPLLITGTLFPEGEFEKRLHADRWTVFLPHSSSLLEDLNGDVEVHYLPSLSDYNAWDLNEVINHLESNEKFSLAKIDLFSPLLPETYLLEIPKLVDHLIPYIKADHLLLTIRIEESRAVETTFRWYSTLHRLFSVSNYALAGAEASGNCGAPVKHCKYRATFVKTDVFGVKEAPVFGLGSPIEERKRLQQYLIRSDLNCSSESKTSPQICLDKANLEDCKIAFFSYQKLDLEFFKSFTCKIFVFHPDPEFDSSEFPSNVDVVETGIATKPKAQKIPGPKKQKNWILLPFSHLIKDREAEILVFDLDGGEWDVLSQITASCDAFIHVNQVAFRLRLWIGEENENYRRFYLYFLRVEACGFQKTVAEKLNDSTYNLAFRRTRVQV
ncbi:hypothetical protein L596_014544 [Steinernema carpocapsae]|uniref:Uncharacterized protein n=1 Tax=Steinernema carpocapsae TaxID=34508 RepID=A0A4U5NCR9_STECR|nr:hypothetical protein L596_014544 [Steinernema carpocapsae]